ncbi:MAG TPA: hypothetical protein VF339_12120 [Gammaproteobacteria bacterium]
MKILTVLLVLLLIVIGLPILASAAWAIFALVLPVAFLVIWFLPILIILCSDKTTGGEKLAWILAIVFLSWFAWIFYFLLAPIKPRYDYPRYTRSYYG